MKTNCYHQVSQKQYFLETKKHPSIAKDVQRFQNWLSSGNETDFQVYIGDIGQDTKIAFEARNLLIVGNVNAVWLDACNPKPYGDGGSLFITGNVTCDYFNGYYGKVIIIGGHLTVRAILNNAFQDSSLIINGNLETEFFHGQDIWAEVREKITLTYGIGYCLPHSYTDAQKQSVLPTYDTATSREYLGIAEETEESPEVQVQMLISARNP
ncbi:hypothetical protein AAG747_09075 [Rapidithrix thailandica]|uniref:Uncharacterized protein n=1 Tax=Rapidithrix thailandica TaxID=413964 RepID=A0AAW9SBF4_9BACT